jgi:hypothetical protein
MFVEEELRNNVRSILGRAANTGTVRMEAEGLGHSNKCSDEILCLIDVTAEDYDRRIKSSCKRLCSSFDEILYLVILIEENHKKPQDKKTSYREAVVVNI